MMFLNFFAAGIWLLYLTTFLIGSYNPDSFTIGFSMFLSIMFFISNMIRTNNRKGD